MNIGKACAIFQRIDSPDYTDIEKGQAILQVTKMPTHMSITKDQMLKVIWWLLNQAFEISEEEKEKDNA